MVNEIPSQTETDLAAIRRMALRNGFVFYVEPTFVGTSRAYFGPQVRGGAIQPAMSVDMGSSSNVSQLSFSNDALATSSPSGTFIEPFSKTSIPIPPLPPLKVPPLSLPQPALRTTVVRDVANRDPSGALVGALRRQAEQPDPVQGTGQVDTARYGAVLRARKLVGVRGVGFGYGGLYHVRSVTHSITRNSYTQQFRIQREGVGSTTPAVMP
jgi:hypothetical protein